MRLFTSSTLVLFLIFNLIIAKETFAVGTLTALAVNFPSNEGITFVTAFPAPVVVITIFIAADLPLLGFLCMLSKRF